MVVLQLLPTSMLLLLYHGHNKTGEQEEKDVTTYGFSQNVKNWLYIVNFQQGHCST